MSVLYLGDFNFKDAKQKISNNEADEADFFFDWFCTTSSLQRRAEQLIKKVQFIINVCKLDESQIRVNFKNSCPVYGELYDCFWITNIKTNQDLFVAPKLGFYDKNMFKKCEISLVKQNNNIQYNSWMEFKKQLRENNNLRNAIIKELN